MKKKKLKRNHIKHVFDPHYPRLNDTLIYEKNNNNNKGSMEISKETTFEKRNA